MQPAGQAAAQRRQPTHFSSPESSKRCSLWRPRKRGYTGVFSSGYWIVTGPSTRRAEGVFRARSVSPEAREGAAPPARGPAEGAVGAAGAAGGGAALDGDDVVAGAPGSHVVTTRIAVTRALRVARGSRIFQPKDMSWS